MLASGMAVTYIAIVCLLLLEVSVTSQQQTVTVQPSGGCGPSATNSSLSEALQNISSNTIISLAGGVHCLSSVSVVQAVSNITLSGPEQDDNTSAIITCSTAAGLAFVNISGLYLQNLQIYKCGVSGNDLVEVVTLTRELVDLQFTVPSDTHIAVYLSSVTNLFMDYVTITNTTGIGLVGVNIIGESQIQNCQFSHNRQQRQQCIFTQAYVTDRGQRLGGGAYFLFQDFRGADVELCNNISAYSLEIRDSDFRGNTECSDLTSVEVNYRDSRRAQRDGYTIGGGGGMGLMFTQVCYAVNVTTTSSVFEANSASSGGAAHIGIFQGVSNSYAIFENCQFTSNGYPTSAFSPSFITHGGAIALYNDLVSPNDNVPVFIHDRNIGLIVKNSDFTDNGAINGGAVLIFSLVTTAVADLTDVAYFYFDNCVFSGNRGAYGAAIFIQELKLHARILGVQVTARDVVVSQNTLETLGSITPISSSDSSAVFEVQGINMTFSGHCVFESNVGSALQGVNSFLGIGGSVLISNNTGLYGGAITLQFSFLIVLPGAALNISNNIARIYGGALYINQRRSSPLATMFDCFLYFNYDQFEFCETCGFAENFTVRFTNNSALLGGTAYGSVLQTCPWAAPLQRQYGNRNTLEILATHFSDNFQFTPHPTGIENVQTPVSDVLIEDELEEYLLSPGQSLPIDIRPLDSLEQSITTLLGVYVALDQDVPSSFNGILDNGVTGYTANSNTSVSLTVFGAENVNTSLIIYSLDLLSNRPAQKQIRVSVLPCPSGFEYDQGSGRCECSEELLRRGVGCSTANLTLMVPSGMWVGPVDNSQFAIADCIPGLCRPGAVNLSVINNNIDFNRQCRRGLNRGGVLCGTCLDGYSNVFGSMRCRECSDASAAFILLFLVIGALIIGFLVYFRVNLSSGYLNGIILWANIVSLYESVLAPSLSHTGVGFLTRVLTLFSGTEICLHERMSALERSWWQLSFPLYLFFLMILLRFLFKTKCCQRVNSKTALATIEAFATLLIVCYISILRTSFGLISRVEITTDDGQRQLRWAGDPTVAYFRGAHGFLAFVACVLITFYLIPMPLVFLFPTVLYKTKYLKKYKPFYDVFWNPFKPEFRFWLGMRLIFRWIPLIVENFSMPPTSTFVTAFFLTLLLFSQMQVQPFQSKWINAIDNLFLLNLILLFLGSLFFTATSRRDTRENQIAAMDRASIYTTCFVVIAYVGIMAVFIYWLFVRFPKLKGYLLKYYQKIRKMKKEKVVVHVPQSKPDDPGYVAGALNQDGQPRMHMIGHTFFRESLLDESGSVEIATYYKIDGPPDASTRGTAASDGTKKNTNSTVATNFSKTSE